VDEATADAEESSTEESDTTEPDDSGLTSGPRDVLSAFDAMILDDVVADEPTEATELMPAVDEPAGDDVSDMPPPSVAPSVSSSVPSDMPPPSAPEPVLGGLAAERKPAEDLVLDPRALKALSRQERKDAKAAIRREAKEAREAARRSRAEAKIDAKADLTDDAESEPVDHIDPVAEAAELLAEPSVEMPPPVVAPPAETPPAEAPSTESSHSSAPPANMPPPTPSGTDPRSRAAARVQRRLGRDAEKVSAAETRARAREEARRRRVQAKELRTGSAVAEAAEAVVRMPDEQLDATAEIPAVDEPILDTPVIEDTLGDDTVVDDTVGDDAETQLIPPIAESPDVLDEIDLDQNVEEPESAADDDADLEDVEELEDPEADAAEFVPPSSDDPIFDEAEVDEAGREDAVIDEPVFDESESVSTQPVPDDMPAPVAAPQTAKPASAKSAAPKWSSEPVDEPTKKSGLGPVAGVIGLIALAISVLLAVSALAVALGVDPGGVYNALQAIADTLVGPLKSAFDFSGSNAERKEHFLAWGAGSLGYLVVSFIGQAVQRANSDDD
jgi:hypothetical protein